jgi:hypothetical protein
MAVIGSGSEGCAMEGWQWQEYTHMGGPVAPNTLNA